MAEKIHHHVVKFVAGALAGTISGFISSLLFKFVLALIKGGEKGSVPTIFGPLIKKPADLAFLQKEEGLASLEIIQRGWCGQVYKAQLPRSNGKMIAIKKIIKPQEDEPDLAEQYCELMDNKMDQIQWEVLTSNHIRHRNLLSLLAHVPRPDCHYLVYEFMKNGSLQDVLNKVETGEGELDWLSRHKIALGVAAGLEYLHMSCSPRIIHRDLNPANILLDDDMEARIADFGLATCKSNARCLYTHHIFKGRWHCGIYSTRVSPDTQVHRQV